MDYDKNYKTNTGFWSTIKDWIRWNYDVIIKYAIVILIIVGAFVGAYTSVRGDMKHTNQRELDWTINDSTFVTKQDNLYIYRRTIEDGEYYFITNHQPGRLKTEQYVPVTKNLTTIKITQ